MDSPQQLRNIRRAVFDQMEKIDSPKAFFELQKIIAKEIQKSEQMAKTDTTGEYKWHMHLLRCYGDALAWMLLHPHTIRQLSKNPSPPPSLVNQGESFEYVLETASNFVDEGVPVLISDITNCLKISDLILCYHPERPVLLECKMGNTPLELLMRGRTGRQISRAMKINQYLRSGEAKLFGESEPSLTIEVDTEIEFTWDTINRTVTRAIDTGESIGISTKSDMMWAFTNDDEDHSPPQEIIALASNYEMMYVGCHARPLEEGNTFIPPPAVWPINRNCRLALMEIEIVLIHFVDVKEFTRVVTQNGRITEIPTEKGPLNEYCFQVEVDNEKYQITPRFLDDVLYGFQTIDSTAKCMIELARKAMELEANQKKPKMIPTGRPNLRVVRNFEEAMQLADEVPPSSGEVFVIMPMTLLDQLNQLRKDNSNQSQD